MERTNHALIAAFAEVLRRRRRAAGLSQEKLAEQADVSVRFISFLETNRRQPTLTIIAALSRGLGINLAEFASKIEATWLAAIDVGEPKKSGQIASRGSLKRSDMPGAEPGTHAEALSESLGGIRDILVTGVALVQRTPQRLSYRVWVRCAEPTSRSMG